MRCTEPAVRLATWLALFTLLASIGAAQPLRSAPINPEYIAYRDAVMAGSWRNVTADGHRLGAIPPLVYRDPKLLRPATLPPASYPASYDLRSVPGKLPAVRDQGPWGSCWAHATYASLESYLLSGETFDASENNLMNLHGLDYNCNQGGHPWMSMAYLARWSGAVSEASDPYNTVTCTSPPGCTPAKHVQEVWILPSRTSATDNDTIKGMVTNYGAVYCVYYHDNTYYNAATHAYYYNGSMGINHAVAVVGWDDNYPAANFNSAPPGNGAFIVRNSWGTGWGEAGYFYVSYYDTQFARSQVAMFPNAEATTNYTGIYSYDPLGDVSEWNCPWAANIFPAPGVAQTIQAVGFYTPTAAANYTAYVYKNPTGGDPRSGTLAATETGSLTYSGYHTVPLSTPVSLSATDTSFSIVTYLTNAGSYPQAGEFVIAGYSSAATASPGQSYGSFDGSGWTDMTTVDSTCNFCLKGYAGAPLPPSLEWAGTTGYETDGVDPDTGDPNATTFTFKVKYTDPSGSAPKRTRCFIQRYDCGDAWRSSRCLNLTKESGDIATGAIYSASIQLPTLVLKYRFYFKAADGSDVAGDPTAYQQGPLLTGRGWLCWTGATGFETDGVDPDSGPLGTNFKFQVQYTDSAGDAPTTCKLLIRRDGKMFRQKDLSPEPAGDLRLGKVYRTSVSLTKSGTYEYRFNLADASGNALGPPNNWTAGPTITGGTLARITSLAAQPTPTGAQITFNLADAAEVTAIVMNVAGRPVKSLVADKPLDPGLQMLAWDRTSNGGLAVPAGIYLVKVVARSADGEQSSAVATVALR